MPELELPRQTVDVAVLKSPDFGDWQARYGSGWQLPYRLDELNHHGIRLHWTDALYRPPWSQPRIASAIRRLERFTAPVAQTLLSARTITRCPVTLAMFESEANTLAAVRALSPGPRRRRLAVIECWLAELLHGFSRTRRALYRRAYTSVDRLFYFSTNQTEVLAEHLGLSHDRLVPITFGIDDAWFSPAGPDVEGDTILAVGRDRGRDWHTLLAAVATTRQRLRILCRPHNIAQFAVPPSVEVLGYVDRFTYRRLLGEARVVALCTKVLAYPSGQSVLLEAMAMGKAVVITDTAAIRDYIAPERNVIAVAPGDVDGWREALLRAADDEQLRHRLGQAGRRDVQLRYNARTMWASIAPHLHQLSGQR